MAAPVLRGAAAYRPQPSSAPQAHQRPETQTSDHNPSTTAQTQPQRTPRTLGAHRNLNGELTAPNSNHCSAVRHPSLTTTALPRAYRYTVHTPHQQQAEKKQQVKRQPTQITLDHRGVHKKRTSSTTRNPQTGVSLLFLKWVLISTTLLYAFTHLTVIPLTLKTRLALLSHPLLTQTTLLCAPSKSLFQCHTLPYSTLRRPLIYNKLLSRYRPWPPPRHEVAPPARTPELKPTHHQHIHTAVRKTLCHYQQTYLHTKNPKLKHTLLKNLPPSAQYNCSSLRPSKNPPRHTWYTHSVLTPTPCTPSNPPHHTQDNNTPHARPTLYHSQPLQTSNSPVHTHTSCQKLSHFCTHPPNPNPRKPPQRPAIEQLKPLSSLKQPVYKDKPRTPHCHTSRPPSVSQQFPRSYPPTLDPLFRNPTQTSILQCMYRRHKLNNQVIHFHLRRLSTPRCHTSWPPPEPQQSTRPHQTSTHPLFRISIQISILKFKYCRNKPHHHVLHSPLRRLTLNQSLPTRP